MRLVVCPASELEVRLADGHLSGVVTIGPPGHPAPATPSALDHLHLAFNDVGAPVPGLASRLVSRLVPPDRAQIERLLAFGAAWDRYGSMLLACELGVSRSPAAAFALACQARPDLSPIVLAGLLRFSSPQATPNALIVALADEILGRGGAMIEAIRSIGRGAEYAGPAGFALPLDLVPTSAP